LTEQAWHVFAHQLPRVSLHMHPALLDIELASRQLNAIAARKRPPAAAIVQKAGTELTMLCAVGLDLPG
jgi:hypothetical protein